MSLARMTAKYVGLAQCGYDLFLPIKLSQLLILMTIILKLSIQNNTSSLPVVDNYLITYNYIDIKYAYEINLAKSKKGCHLNDYSPIYVLTTYELNNWHKNKMCHQLHDRY